MAVLPKFCLSVKPFQNSMTLGATGCTALVLPVGDFQPIPGVFEFSNVCSPSATVAHRSWNADPKFRLTIRPLRNDTKIDGVEAHRTPTIPLKQIMSRNKTSPPGIMNEQQRTASLVTEATDHTQSQARMAVLSWDMGGVPAEREQPVGLENGAAPRTQAPIGSTGGDAASRSTPPATLLAETTIVEIHVGPSKTYRVFRAEKDCTETQFLEKIHERSA
ncbi:hypothetical protein B0H14DRAFT_3147862 [Mycena olivaceomarginata]|nr:hypothetical protein B0H14DRAFT_3147862 [Mycena olivaceomarginata]